MQFMTKPLTVLSLGLTLASPAAFAADPYFTIRSADGKTSVEITAEAIERSRQRHLQNHSARHGR